MFDWIRANVYKAACIGIGAGCLLISGMLVAEKVGHWSTKRQLEAVNLKLDRVELDYGRCKTNREELDAAVVRTNARIRDLEEARYQAQKSFDKVLSDARIREADLNKRLSAMRSITLTGEVCTDYDRVDQAILDMLK